MPQVPEQAERWIPDKPRNDELEGRVLNYQPSPWNPAICKLRSALMMVLGTLGTSPRAGKPEDDS